MLTEPTVEKLELMRLAAMASAWLAQQKDPALGALSFDERFGMIVDAEYSARDNRRMTKLLKDAALRIPNACIEDVRVSAQRGLDKAVLRQLATCTWVGEHLNILITGPTGVGKSYLASALGQAACRKKIRVLYRRVPRLFDELALARADGSYDRVLSRFAKADVLILDDLGLGGALREGPRHDLLEVLEDRYGRSSTIITSQLEVKNWHDWIGDPTLADAILDRVVHNAYKLSLTGPSGRKDKEPKQS